MSKTNDFIHKEILQNLLLNFALSMILFLYKSRDVGNGLLEILYFQGTIMSFLQQTTIINITDNLENCIPVGNLFRAKCPICKSNSSRPFVLFENGGYYCHSCNEKGGAFGLIEDVLKLKLSNFKNILNKLNPFTTNQKNNQKYFQFKQKEFHKSIENNRERIFELLHELIPKNTKDLKLNRLNKFIGYDDKNNSLAINLIDDKLNIKNIKRRKVGNIKWLGLKGGDGKFAPSRLTGKEFVFVASGIAEFMILHASDLDYVVMQSDGIDINHLLPRAVTAVIIEDNDKKDIEKKEDEEFRCFKNPSQFNPFQKKVTKKILGEKIAINFEKVLDRELKAGYDLRDFITEFPNNWKSLIETEIDNLSKKIEKVEDEIVINYRGQYPDYLDKFPSVVISRTNSGKTFQYEKQAGNLILVPKSYQSNLMAGTNTKILLDKISNDGAIITFHKFYGHYKTNLEFRKLIDGKKIKLIVDEAHELVLNPSPEFQLIYNLDAIFLSATLEKFFRRDLQRYKYKPENPDIIYYTTDGELPKDNRSIIFMDNVNALKNNYPNNSILGKQHNFKSPNIHTTNQEIVFTTSALREGISIKNPNFNACMVYAKECKMWNNKNTIQALYRLRVKNSLKIVSAPPKKQYEKYIDYSWWENRIHSYTNEQTTNTIMGEHYSKLIKITHKINQYQKADEYSIVCYLSELTKNNYDKDFYKFEEYKEDFEPLEINTKIEKLNIEDENKEFFNYIFENGEEWSIPQNRKKAFERWLESDKSGLIDKIVKLDKYKNLNEIYLKSNLAKTIKAKYNKIYKNKKYTIQMFYKLLKSLVQLEMINDETGKIIKRVGSKTNLKKISIKVVAQCLIKGIKIIKKVVTKVKIWLDSFKDIKTPAIDDYSDISSSFRSEIRGVCFINKRCR